MLYHVPGDRCRDHDLLVFTLISGRSGSLILTRVVPDRIRRFIRGILYGLVAGAIGLYVIGIQYVGGGRLAVACSGTARLRTGAALLTDLFIDLGGCLVLQVGLLGSTLLTRQVVVDFGCHVGGGLVELAQISGNVRADRCRDRVGDILIVGITLQIQIAAEGSCTVHVSGYVGFRDVNYDRRADCGLIACRIAAGLGSGIRGRCAMHGQVAAVFCSDLCTLRNTCVDLGVVKYDNDGRVDRSVVHGRGPAGIGHACGCVDGIGTCNCSVQTLLGMIRDDVCRGGFRRDLAADVGFGHIVDVGENDGRADADAFAVRVLGTSLLVGSDQSRVNDNVITGYKESIGVPGAGILDGDRGLLRAVRLGIVEAAILDLEAVIGSDGHIDRVRLFGFYAAGGDDVVFIGQEYLILGQHALLDIILELVAQGDFPLESLEGDLHGNGLVLAQRIDLGLLNLVNIGLAFDRCQHGLVFRAGIRVTDLCLGALDGIQLKAVVRCNRDGVAAVALFADGCFTVLGSVHSDLILCALLILCGPDFGHVGGRTSIRIYGGCGNGLDVVVIDGLDIELTGNGQGLFLILVCYISSGGSVHEFHGQGTCNAYVYSTGAGNSSCLSIVCCLGSGVAFCFRLFDLCQNVEVLGCDLLGGNIDIVLVMRVVDRYRYAYALIGIDSFTTCQGDCIGLIETKYIDILFRCDRACVCDIRFGNIVEVVDQEGCCNFNGAFTGLRFLSVRCLVVQCGGPCAGQAGSVRHVERRGSRAVSYLVSLPVRAVSFRTGSSGS